MVEKLGCWGIIGGGGRGGYLASLAEKTQGYPISTVRAGKKEKKVRRGHLKKDWGNITVKKKKKIRHMELKTL